MKWATASDLIGVATLQPMQGDSRGPNEVYWDTRDVDQLSAAFAAGRDGARERHDAPAQEDRPDGDGMDADLGLWVGRGAYVGRTSPGVSENDRGLGGALDVLRPIHSGAGEAASKYRGRAVRAGRAVPACSSRGAGEVCRCGGCRRHGGQASPLVGEALCGNAHELPTRGGEAAPSDERQGPGGEPGEAHRGAGQRPSDAAYRTLGARPVADVRPGLLPLPNV